MKLTEFQFPSNGKMDPNSNASRNTQDVSTGFQFPSNGKMDPNVPYGDNVLDYENLFQFPSNGKVDPNFTWHRKFLLYVLPGFNSLQTGKWILTWVKMSVWIRDPKFQFPSNGKVDPNTADLSLSSRCRHYSLSFNSLQTGKVDPNKKSGFPCRQTI